MPAGDMPNVSGQMRAGHVTNEKMETAAAEQARANTENAFDSVSSRRRAAATNKTITISIASKAAEPRM